MNKVKVAVGILALAAWIAAVGSWYLQHLLSIG